MPNLLPNESERKKSGGGGEGGPFCYLVHPSSPLLVLKVLASIRASLIIINIIKEDRHQYFSNDVTHLKLYLKGIFGFVLCSLRLSNFFFPGPFVSPYEMSSFHFGYGSLERRKLIVVS